MKKRAAHTAHFLLLSGVLLQNLPLELFGQLFKCMREWSRICLYWVNSRGSKQKGGPFWVHPADGEAPPFVSAHALPQRKPPDRLSQAVLVMRGCAEFRRSPGFGRAIRHGHGAARRFQHSHIVAIVPYGHQLIRL